MTSRTAKPYRAHRRRRSPFDFAAPLIRWSMAAHSHACSFHVDCSMPSLIPASVPYAIDLASCRCLERRLMRCEEQVHEPDQIDACRNEVADMQRRTRYRWQRLT